MSKKQLSSLGGARDKISALNHPIRSKILALIEQKVTVNVTEIYKSLKLEQSVTSQHLRTLREANLVLSKRRGKEIIYSINKENIAKLQSLANEIVAI